MDPLLTGIRVIEFGNLIASPYAGMLLADLGADVIKVEPPGGDLGRRFGPYVDGESVFFGSTNRGKRSLVLDLSDGDSQDVARRLCLQADVVLHNLLPGAMERRRLGEADLRTSNPRLIYAVISAFAASGHEATRAGIDIVFQAEAGMISITGDPGGPVAKTATTIGDYLAGTNIALAICAALAAQARYGGVGRRIDVSLRDGVMAAQAGWNSLHLATGTQPARTGTASPFLAPNQIFPTEDGALALAIVSDEHFKVLAEALERPDLADSFRRNDERMERCEELTAIISEILRTRSTRFWFDRLVLLGIPVGQVRSLDEAFAVAPHMKLDLGRSQVTGSPISVDAEMAVCRRPAPRLGEHTAEVLAELDHLV